MKFIKPLSKFSHAGKDYYPGERRAVTPEDAGYFCGLGWAQDDSDGEKLATGELDHTPKTLEVQSVRHRSAATTPGA